MAQRKMKRKEIAPAAYGGKGKGVTWAYVHNGWTAAAVPAPPEVPGGDTSALVSGGF